jgi:hypothetical protein
LECMLRFYWKSIFGQKKTINSILENELCMGIVPSYSKLRSIDTYGMHQVSFKWLQSSLEASTTNKNIVVTHHAPSPKSIPHEFKNDIVSSAYASDLEPFILQYRPQFWIHGHIHTPIKYEVGSTKVICNPHGYVNEPYNGFEPKLLIEI